MLTREYLRARGLAALAKEAARVGMPPPTATPPPIMPLLEPPPSPPSIRAAFPAAPHRPKAPRPETPRPAPTRKTAGMGDPTAASLLKPTLAAPKPAPSPVAPPAAAPPTAVAPQAAVGGGLFGGGQSPFANNPAMLGQLYSALGPAIPTLAKYTGGLGLYALNDLFMHGGKNLQAFQPKPAPAQPLPQAQPTP